MQDIVMGRANAGLDLMWDLAFAFEVEDRTFDGKTGVAAVIAWVQSRVADTERELAVTDLTSRYESSASWSWVHVVAHTRMQLCRWLSVLPLGAVLRPLGHSFLRLAAGTLRSSPCAACIAVVICVKLIREMQHQRLENLNLAFNTAEKLFQVPRLMTAQDFLDNCPDERSVLLYLAIMQGRTGQ